MAETTEMFPSLNFSDLNDGEPPCFFGSEENDREMLQWLCGKIRRDEYPQFRGGKIVWAKIDRGGVGGSTPGTRGNPPKLEDGGSTPPASITPFRGNDMDQPDTDLTADILSEPWVTWREKDVEEFWQKVKKGRADKRKLWDKFFSGRQWHETP